MRKSIKDLLLEILKKSIFSWFSFCLGVENVQKTGMLQMKHFRKLLLQGASKFFVE